MGFAEFTVVNCVFDCFSAPKVFESFLEKLKVQGLQDFQSLPRVGRYAKTQEVPGCVLNGPYMKDLVNCLDS